MKTRSIGAMLFTLAATGIAASQASGDTEIRAADSAIGRVNITTIPFPADLAIRSATYTPSGKVLVTYSKKGNADPQFVKLAVMDDDGKAMRPFFAQTLPKRPKDNGIRYMVFADNKRIFLGDFVIECAAGIDACTNPTLLPVDYPPDVADGDHISHRWSEMIVAPDNRHISWTTLLSNYSAMVFTGELQRVDDRYKIVDARIISTIEPFRKDPGHADGVLPNMVRGGEVKQFVQGSSAISVVGAIRRDTPDSVVLHIASGRMEGITDMPGYTETTIFSPDERLGATMTTRFSERTDPAILSLMPRPYPVALNMGLSMFAYTYAVTGVREDRGGNIGPALIDIEASKAKPGYLGTNLSTDADWVFRSPLSWHPDGKRAMWVEGHRGDGQIRIQVARLPDYRPAPAVARKPFPQSIPYSSSDLSVAKDYARKSQELNARIYGRKQGHIEFRRSPDGVIEKRYVDFSDDGRSVYSGKERTQVNLRGQSTYSADIRLSGPQPGVMKLQIVFGPLGGKLPARIIFDKDASGQPMSHGFAEYGGQRLSVDTLLP